MYTNAPFAQAARRKGNVAFTLVETLMAIAILALAMAGLIYGYVQTTYQSGWSSMSLVAQSLALESVERARAAKWCVYSLGATGGDEMPPGTYMNIFTNAVLLSLTGQTETVTNTLQITTVGTYPPVRQIRADCVWQFKPGSLFTNTVITLRGGN
jgi:type II secretory pathway pseudopilin PulG